MSKVEKKIEGFEKKVDDVKKSLEKLKKETDQTKIDEQKQKANETIASLKSAIDTQLTELEKNADEHTSDIEKLQKMKESLETVEGELGDLKKEVEKSADDKKGTTDDTDKNDEDTDTKDKKDKKKDKGNASLWSRMIYGGLIANTLGNIPGIGKSIKEWAKGKEDESAEEDAKEKKEGKKDEDTGIGHKIWNFVKWSAIGTGVLWLGKKVLPDNWRDKVKGWFGFGDKKEEEKKDDTTNKPTPSSSLASTGSASGAGNENPNQNPAEGGAEVVPADGKQPETGADPQAVQEVEHMKKEGYSDLFILMRMYELGFMPKIPYKFTLGSVLDGAIFQKGGEWNASMRDRMSAKIHGSMDELKIKKMNLDLHRPDVGAFYDQELDKLIKLDDDLKAGKISSLKDLKASKEYSEYAEGLSKKTFKTLDQKIDQKYKSLDVVKGAMDTYDQEIKKLHTEAKTKLQAFDEEAKKKIKDPKALEEIRKKAKISVEEYNKKILEFEKKAGIRISHLPVEQIKLFPETSLVGKITKINGGGEKFLAKTKTGKIMLGIAVMSLLGKGFSGGSMKEVGLQAADLAAGIVPYAGGAYDIGCAIKGTCIAGDLSVKERWIRGSIGVLSLGLDVVGTVLAVTGVGTAPGIGVIAGSSALKGLAKTSVKVGVKSLEAAKVVEKVAEAGKDVEKAAEATSDISKVAKVAEGTKQVMKLGNYGFLGYSLVDGAAPYVVDAYSWGKGKVTPSLPV